MIRRNYNSKSVKRRGFTLIELAIVLAVTSLLAAGLWRMMSAGNSQMRDQAAADQQRELISAVRGYLASQDGYNYLSDAALITTPTFPLPLPATAGACAAPHATFCNFLPPNFTSNTANSYGQTYRIRVLRHTHTNAGVTTLDGYSFMILSSAGDVIPDTSGGRISSMIGNDGGFIYTANVCGAGGPPACGAYGTWSAIPTTDYGFASAVAGHIATRTHVGMSASLNTPWLARMDVPGDVVTNGSGDFNTMQVDLSLGGNGLFGNGTGDGGSIELTALTPTGATARALTIAAQCTPTAYTDDPLVCADVVKITGGVSVTGLLKANQLYAGQFVYETSDERLKRDIKPLEDVLGKFSQINGYSFYLKEGGEKKLGVIAQEVEKVFPELIHDIGNDYKGVDYMGLIGPLVSAVNELRAENVKLRAELTEQAKAIEALKAKKAK